MRTTIKLWAVAAVACASAILMPMAEGAAPTADPHTGIVGNKGVADGWVRSFHGCPGGNRTDALFRDPDGTLWVGCGTNAVGYGLFRSDDGGSAWSEVATSPANALDEFRVSSISRGHDDALYIAGFRATTRDMVLRLDTASAPFAVTTTLVGFAQVGRQFHVGTYRELDDGSAMAESLNGVDLLYRPDGGVGSSASLWTKHSLPSQILAMDVFDGFFFGVGSSIIEPPQVFLPPLTMGAEPFEFEILALPTQTPWEGELWGMAVNEQLFVGVGVDQDNDVGKIFVSNVDPYDTSDYIEHSLPDIVGPGGIGTWARGACVRGNRIIVTGERQPIGSRSGLVVESLDGGESFQDITPDDVSGSVSKCVIEPDGTLVVAGAGGYVGIRVTDPLIFRAGFE